ncbi:MAG: 4-alpha-glucanotransferase [Bacteroidales bacterium]|nr:4-alpha-glucanotransferase [Bacteroidales bacterium]
MSTIKFSIHYDTAWGEELKLRIAGTRYDMNYVYGGLWQKDIPASKVHDGDICVYEIVRDGILVRREWRGRVWRAPKGSDMTLCRDRWCDRPHGSAFFSSAFSDVIFRRPDGTSFRRPRKEDAKPGNLTIVIPAAEIRAGQSVALFASSKALGSWKKPHILSDRDFPWWSITLDAKGVFEYKFAVIDTKSKEIIAWECGANHLFAEVPPKGSAIVISDLDVQFPTLPWRGAGVAVPVFSLRTADSFGIGEFADIKRLVDWSVETGMNVIQLLPINDTTMTRTWQDSYPYNAVSSFALHPQFISLPAAGIRQDKAYKALRDELNALPQVDYERVNNEKERLLRKYFGAHKETVCASEKFSKFLSDNAEWLIPFAVFSALRDEKGTPDFSEWGKWASYSGKAVAAYAGEHKDEVNFYIWEQMLLDEQLADAVKYAHIRGVALKGDLPIGVSRRSVDAWQHPELFHLDSQAGAPPDAFSVDGQNWGFPTYNWEKMSEDGFAWWKGRMRKMSEYFDAFRIDHILGFFRIWEIPMRWKTGLMGHFSPALPYSLDELRNAGFEPWTPQDDNDTNVLFVEDPRRPGWWHPRISGQSTRVYQDLPDWLKQRYDKLYEDFFYRRHNDFWRDSAMWKLPALLRSTGMLSCGEDLGMIPACVPSVMDEMNILSLEIQRMPKSVKETFGNPSSYPYFSVCATGTHDTSPLRAWWEEDRELTQKFYNEALHCEGAAPYFCEPWVAEKVVAEHLKSPSMLAILPLQDYLAIDGAIRYQGNPADERINIPAIPRHYWRYRMHCTLESLIYNTDFSAHLKALVSDSGRGI